jgi:type IV secretory pathway VirJ component
MNAESTLQNHIAITEGLLRLYVFVTQYLDRSQYESAGAAYSEHDLQGLLSSTQAEVMELLAVNRVVQHKVEQECTRVLSIAAACHSNECGKAVEAVDVDELKAARWCSKPKL